MGSVSAPLSDWLSERIFTRYGQLERTELPLYHLLRTPSSVPSFRSVCQSVSRERRWYFVESGPLSLDHAPHLDCVRLGTLRRWCGYYSVDHPPVLVHHRTLLSRRTRSSPAHFQRVPNPTVLLIDNTHLFFRASIFGSQFRLWYSCVWNWWNVSVEVSMWSAEALRVA